jgi:3-phenylpropionate/trans-cinnamate dioxygenase ferredoxin subunit
VTTPARAPRKPAFADVGPVDRFPVGRFEKAGIPGKDVWVMRTPDGNWFAIKNTCPHQGAPICLGHVDGTWLPSAPGELEFGLEYQLIRCPYHAYEYDLEKGCALFIPDVLDRIIRYDVRIENERVLVSLKGH